MNGSLRGAGGGGEVDRLQRAATDNLPRIDFDFAAGRFEVVGESSPTDARGFYGPLTDRLRRHLAGPGDGEARFLFELTYMNSGTARVLMEIFDLIEEASMQGRRIAVEWRHHEQDDQLRDLGQEYADELTGVSFNLVAVTD